MDDSYLFDAQEDRVVFRKDRLIRVMNRPTFKERTDDIEQVGQWLDGKVLCNRMRDGSGRGDVFPYFSFHMSAGVVS